MSVVTDQIQTEITTKADTGGVEEAKSALSGFGDSLNNIRDIAVGVGLEKLTEKFIEFGEAAVSAGIQSASSLENIKIGFDTAFGDAASNMLNALDQMSYKTPFASDQLDGLALRLREMGAPVQQISGDLLDVADIASGTGTSFAQMSEIMQTATDALSVAFQRGSVSSLQLRSFANQGIPIYDALVKVLNASGDTIEKGGKQATAAAKQHEALTTKIKEQSDALRVLESEHPKTADATNKHNLAIEKASDALKKLQDEYTKTGVVMGSATASIITKQDLLTNSKNIKITAQQLQQALQLLGEGKYLGSAQKQADTFAGVMKNLRQVFIDTSRDILGVSSGDVVQKGGLFDQLHQAVTLLFDFLKAHKDEIIGFFSAVKTAVSDTSGFIANTLVPAFKSLAPIIGPAFEFIIGEIRMFLIPLVSQLQDLWKQHATTIREVATAIGVILYVALVGVIGLIGGLANIIVFLANKFLSFAEALRNMFNTIANGINSFINGLKKLSIPGLPHLASGVTNFAGGPAIVGENGPEMVYLPSGASVQPNVNNSRNVNISMQNQVNGNADWSSIAKEIGWRVNGR